MNEKTGKGIPGSTLKIIAIITMLIDHIGATLVEYSINARGYAKACTSIESMALWLSDETNRFLDNADTVMRMIGRLGFPLFCFLLVEGFNHTRSRAKYVLRMLLFCVIAEIPFNLAIAAQLFSLDFQSVFFTLTIGLLTIWGMETLRNKTGFKTAGSILRWLSYFMFGWMGFYVLIKTTIGEIILAFLPAGTRLYAVELGIDVGIPNLTFVLLGSVFGIISLIAFAIISRKDEKETAIAKALQWFPAYGGIILADFLMTDYGGVGVLTIVIMYLLRERKTSSIGWGVALLTIYNPIEFTAFLDVPLVSKYNGERGLKIKYFFYIFYPAHLLILYLIGHFIFGVM